ncbi:sterol desaturase family protein [Sphingomonas sp. HF-S3]|uniref:Sterol desaturase family protein n=1 Tax=Sphingomonas rustica TaxID=3103142 RepID=A0ABV0B3D4_9SPHN
MDLIERLGANAGAYVWSWSFAFILMTIVEVLVPRERQTLRCRISGLIFWAIWLPTSTLIFSGFRQFWAMAGIGPVVSIPLEFEWAGPAALILSPIAAAAVYDFFFYWCHRFQHKFLWRFHSVHHSIQDLNSVNSYHHITEPIIQSLLILIPTSLVASQAGPASSIVTVLIYIHGSFIHSPTRYNFGGGRLLLVDNRFHRIHHSLEPRHFDKNFGAFTTVWDRLFGTAHFPGVAEWPQCGLADTVPPRTIREWLVFPFKIRDGSSDSGEPELGAPDCNVHLSDKLA